MKKMFTLSMALIIMVSIAKAQYKKAQIDPEIAKKSQILLNPVKSKIMTEQEVRSSNLDRTLPDWNPGLVGVAIVHELPESVEQEIADKTKQKINNLKVHYPDGPEGSVLNNPTIGASFPANIFGGLTPPDNSIAISNGGYIVSVVNTNIQYYSINGTNLFSSSFTNFFNDPSLTGNIYDPVVLYDSGSDRFFMVVLNTSASATSKVICCFSKSNNPNDGWWYYKLTGNPLTNGCWFDYPRIGVSTNEVYVTGNLYQDNGTWTQSVIYQITKSIGYAGGSLNWQFWQGITNSPFTLVPISYGQEGNYGPGIYLISTHASNPMDQIYFFDLTNDMTGSPQLNAYTINQTYALAGNALQNGSTVVLKTDDTRVFSAFYLNGIVHYTFHSQRSNNYYGVNYNRLTVSSLLNWNVNFGADGYDYCYPSVASFGTSASDKSVMIAFSRSGSSIYPETRVFYVDDSGTYSNSTLVKAGDTYVDVYQNSSGVTRWGDYTGICRKQNSSSPEVWLSGCYGAVESNTHVLDSWISQVTGVTFGIPVLINNREGLAKVYPNPVLDMFKLEFFLDKKEMVKITLNDAAGRMVKLLLSDMAEEGKNMFTFNKGVLQKGIYFLQIRSGNSIIADARIVMD